MVPLCVSFLTDKRDISALKIEQSNRWVNEELVDKLNEGKARSKLLKKPRAEAVVRSRWLYMLPVLRSKSFKVWVNNNYFHVFFLMGFRVNNTILTFLPSFFRPCIVCFYLRDYVNRIQGWFFTRIKRKTGIGLAERLRVTRRGFEERCIHPLIDKLILSIHLLIKTSLPIFCRNCFKQGCLPEIWFLGFFRPFVIKFQSWKKSSLKLTAALPLRSRVSLVCKSWSLKGGIKVLQRT